MVRTSVLAKATRIDPCPSHQNALTETSKMTAGQVEVVLRTSDGSELVLPTELVQVLIASAGELAIGHAVTIMASETQLTPAEAAEMLGLSRPFVARLLDSGDIPSTCLPGSRHRVVRLADILAFQAARDRRKEGRRQIADAVEEAGLPY